MTHVPHTNPDSRFENGEWWWTFEDASRPFLLWDDYGLPAGSASSTAEVMPEDEALVCDSDLFPIRPGDISDEEVRDLYLPKVPEAA